MASELKVGESNFHGIEVIKIEREIVSTKCKKCRLTHMTTKDQFSGMICESRKCLNMRGAI